jgi:hypothetical protein
MSTTLAQTLPIRILRLESDPDLIAVSVFSLIGLLVSLSLAAFYPMLAAESLVNMMVKVVAGHGRVFV